MTLWMECEHGELVEHDIRDPAGFLVEPWRCPGGRQATPVDLIEALGGEKVWWCEEHRAEIVNHLVQHPLCWMFANDQVSGSDCRMVERILTPALDQEAPR